MREGEFVVGCVVCGVGVCVFCDWGLISGCYIGREGCDALDGGLEGSSALKSISLWGA